MRTDDLLGALWLPDDGKVNPADVTQALAQRRAHERRAHFRADARHRDPSEGRRRDRRRDDAAATSRPRSSSIAPANGRSRSGRMCGVTVPLHSAEHMYIVTGRIDGVHPDLPVLRDPDGYIYVKEEVGGLLMGGFEPVAKPWAHGRHPGEFRVRHAARRLGSVPDPDGERADPAAGARDRRDQDLHERAGELHARQQLHHGRGAGAEEFLRRRRLQLDRHRVRRRGRARARRMDRRRASRRSISGRSISAASRASTTTTAS